MRWEQGHDARRPRPGRGHTDRACPRLALRLAVAERQGLQLADGNLGEDG
jgi:hypothetical protein